MTAFDKLLLEPFDDEAAAAVGERHERRRKNYLHRTAIRSVEREIEGFGNAVHVLLRQAPMGRQVDAARRAEIGTRKWAACDVAIGRKNVHGIEYRRVSMPRSLSRRMTLSRSRSPPSRSKTVYIQ